MNLCYLRDSFRTTSVDKYSFRLRRAVEKSRWVAHWKIALTTTCPHPCENLGRQKKGLSCYSHKALTGRRLRNHGGLVRSHILNLNIPAPTPTDLLWLFFKVKVLSSKSSSTYLSFSPTPRSRCQMETLHLAILRITWCLLKAISLPVPTPAETSRLFSHSEPTFCWGFRSWWEDAWSNLAIPKPG